jgi:hypothetical protein
MVCNAAKPFVSYGSKKPDIRPVFCCLIHTLDNTLTLLRKGYKNVRSLGIGECKDLFDNHFYSLVTAVGDSNLKNG